MSAHLGARVSALLDGHLSPAEEERCWAHVHECHACRDLVEREGWVKTRLASMSIAPATSAPDRLKDSLLGQGDLLRPRACRTIAHVRHRGLVAIGGGAAGVAVAGVIALGAAGGQPRVDPRPPAAELPRPAVTSGTSQTGSGAPGGTVRAPLAERMRAIREKMAP